MLIKNKCFFISNNTIGPSGISGGDRIFIELAKNWKDKIEIIILASEEAISVCKEEGLGGIRFIKTSERIYLKNVFTLKAILLNFFKKLINGVSFVIRNRGLFKGNAVIYSVSDFYPDSIPAFIIKILNPDIVWIAGFYLFAPAPWQGDNPYKGKDLLRGMLYWISQKSVYYLVNKFADFVFITSEPDRERFITQKRGRLKVIVVKGGVDISRSNEYLKNMKSVPINDRKYDACFIGRFHRQKGVLILIDIWNKIVEQKPNAMLAMIGNGGLEGDVRRKIKEFGIENNVELFGFLDGEKKYDIFKQTKIVVHPATFDSGGMASAEAMAWRLPGISFDLEALRTYYPKGMIKVPLGDCNMFVEGIMKLLSDRVYYEELADEARRLVVEEWDWNKRANEIFGTIFYN